MKRERPEHDAAFLEGVEAKRAEKRSGVHVRQKDVKFVKALAKGKSLAEAAQLVARHPDVPLKAPRQSANERLQKIRKIFPELLKRYGLGERDLVEKYLKPLVEAKAVKYFVVNGEIVASPEYVDLGARRDGLEMCMKLHHGSYTRNMGEEQGPVQLNKIEVIIQDVSREDSHTVTTHAGAAS